MATFTPTRNPRGGGHYDSEENLPYKKGAGSVGDSPPGGRGFRPGGAGRTRKVAEAPLPHGWLVPLQWSTRNRGGQAGCHMLAQPSGLILAGSRTGPIV